MKRIILLSCILMLSAVWAVAQYEQPSTASQSSPDASKTTIEGCLAGSDGNYSLTDKSGIAYQLTGNTTKLQNHVGHTIQVTGTSTSGASSNMAGKTSTSMSAPSDAQPTFTVTSFKHVSGNCTATH
jgi:hypothetical protein